MRRCAAAAAAAARGSIRAISRSSWRRRRSAWSRSLAHPLPLAAVTALLGWWLLLIAALDLEHQWLPDRLTLPLIPLGLAAAWAGFGPPLAERLAGAAIGWAALAADRLPLPAAARPRRDGRRRSQAARRDRRLGRGVAAAGRSCSAPACSGWPRCWLMRLRGEPVAATSRLPLGTLMALAAWPVWLVVAALT